MSSFSASSESPQPSAAPELAVVGHNIVSIFREADGSSEQLSQVLMGTRVRVFERTKMGEFARVEGDDRYEGWLRAKYLERPSDVADNPRTTIASLIADLHSSPSAQSQIVTKLVVTTPIVLARHSSDRDFLPVILPSGEIAYTHRANLSSSYQRDISAAPMTSSDIPSAQTLAALKAGAIPKLMELAVESALLFIGTPYLWGGSTPFGIDCSGLVQIAYKIAGIQLLRDAWMQMADLRFVNVEEDVALADAHLAPGDLIFFLSRDPNSERRIGHVGLAVGDGSFVHAAGSGNGVIVTGCDDRKWNESYAGARRLSPNADLSIQSA